MAMVSEQMVWRMGMDVRSLFAHIARCAGANARVSGHAWCPIADLPSPVARFPHPWRTPPCRFPGSLMATMLTLGCWRLGACSTHWFVQPPVLVNQACVLYITRPLPHPPARAHPQDAAPGTGGMTTTTGIIPALCNKLVSIGESAAPPVPACAADRTPALGDACDAPQRKWISPSSASSAWRC